VSSQSNELYNESQPETDIPMQPESDISMQPETDLPAFKKYRKPRFDSFTMMLFISLICIGLAITCLYLTLETYQWEFRLKKDFVSQIETPASITTTYHV